MITLITSALVTSNTRRTGAPAIRTSQRYKGLRLGPIEGPLLPSMVQYPFNMECVGSHLLIRWILTAGTGSVNPAVSSCNTLTIELSAVSLAHTAYERLSVIRYLDTVDYFGLHIWVESGIRVYKSLARWISVFQWKRWIRGFSADVSRRRQYWWRCCVCIISKAELVCRGSGYGIRGNLSVSFRGVTSLGPDC